MSNRAGSDAVIGGMGCLLAVGCWLGGPLLVGWVLRSATDWPTWVIVILALVLGEIVGSLLLFSVLMPIIGITSLFGKYKR
jgi:hypothetical protein